LLCCPPQAHLGANAEGSGQVAVAVIVPTVDIRYAEGLHMGHSTPGMPRLRSYNYATIFLFSLITLSALVGLPTFAYFSDYTWLDWTLFGSLYVISGLGITVGYHRLIAHRSFTCPNWVKASLLIAGGWALENSVLMWASDHIRHHARCDQEDDPYNAQRGFWYSHCGWIFSHDPYADEKYASRLRQDPVAACGGRTGRHRAMGP
jgi:stearoyl-CoA desaturase (Delta-9 desaturase)